jgi:hypothetical protein
MTERNAEDAKKFLMDLEREEKRLARKEIAERKHGPTIPDAEAKLTHRYEDLLQLPADPKRGIPAYAPEAEQNLTTGQALTDDGDVALPIQVIDHVRRAIRAGLFPHPKALFYIAGAFEKYRASGVVDLDEAFGLISNRRAGSPAAQSRRADFIQALVDQMHVYVRDAKLSQEKAATRVREEVWFHGKQAKRGDAAESELQALKSLGGHIPFERVPSVASLTRYYRAWLVAVRDARAGKTPKRFQRKPLP